MTECICLIIICKYDNATVNKKCDSNKCERGRVRVARIIFVSRLSKTKSLSINSDKKMLIFFLIMSLQHDPILLFFIRMFCFFILISSWYADKYGINYKSIIIAFISLLPFCTYPSVQSTYPSERFRRNNVWKDWFTIYYQWPPVSLDFNYMIHWKLQYIHILHNNYYYDNQ